MFTRFQTKTKAESTPAPRFTPARSGFLQRYSTNQPEPATVPPILHEVLCSPGQPLDSATREFMEPRFGHDFSRLRVHTDAKAAQSARTVKARAYTVGRDIVFGQGQYAPETTAGKRLLAHELTHAVQQGSSRQGLQNRLKMGAPGGIAEQEAETASKAIVKGQRFTVTSREGIGIFASNGEEEGTEQGRRIASRQPPIAQPAGVRQLLGEMCHCGSSTRVAYDRETYQFIRSTAPLIRSIAGTQGVPLNPVAGAIADEYNTRRGVRRVVDGVQDAVIDALPECFIDVDRFFDIRNKLLNTLENDVGPANIKVRTALELVQRGELRVPGSPPSNIQVNRIVDFLLTERGTVQATTAVINRAQRLFGSHLTGYPAHLSEAILVSYFKQGDSYYNRFRRALDADPSHQVCPGDGGCRFIYNRDRLQSALTS